MTGASLLFIGTRHTFAPQDPQLVQLQTLVNEFAPTIAFIEGGRWPIDHPPAVLVEKYGEMAFVARVASDRGATLVDADPPFADEMQSVATRFGIKTAKLFYVLRRVPQALQESGAGTPEQRLDTWANSRQLNVLPGMSEVLTSLEEVDAELKKAAPRIGTWRDASDPNVASPNEHRSLINEVARASVAYREEFIAQKIEHSLTPGRRVLLAMGGSHLESMQSSLKIRLARIGHG